MNNYNAKNLLRKAAFTLLFAGFMLNSNLAQAIIFENVLVNGKTKAVACANKPIIISSGNMYENNIKNRISLAQYLLYKRRSCIINF